MKRPQIKWIKALRSGKYKQGTGKLHEDDRFCCWGVLCEIAIESGVIAEYDGLKPIPPKEVQDWVGIGNGFAVWDLVVQNDHKSKTFPEIANYIEQRASTIFR